MKRCRIQWTPLLVFSFAIFASVIFGEGAPALRASEKVKPGMDSTWQNLMEAGEASFRLGNFDDAENLFAMAACSEQNANANELLIATSLMREADACCKEERFATADRLYKRALEIRERKLGTDHTDVVQVLSKQAWLEERHRNYLMEEEIYRRILKIEQKKFGAESPSVAITMKNIAHCIYERAFDLDPKPAEPRKNPAFVDAENLLEKALAICEKSEGTNSKTATQILDEQSHMYWMYDYFSKGEQCLRRALAIRDTYLAPDDPLLESNLRGLIGIKARQNTEDRVLFKRVLAIWKKNPTALQTPPSRTNQVICLNNRGVLCLNMGEYQMAEEYFLKALQIDPNYKLCSENLNIVRMNMKSKESDNTRSLLQHNTTRD
jgi:tetratricopeptide (TPR) repeat protein